MTEIVDTIINGIDLILMFVTNIVTYLVIKVIDELNGDKDVSTNIRRFVSFISAIFISIIIILIDKEPDYTKTFYSCILSLVSWDLLFKPIIERFKTIDYK